MMREKIKEIRRKIKISLKYNIVAVLSLVSIVVSLLLLIVNGIVSNEIRMQVSEANSNVLKLYMQQMDESFYNIERSLVNLLLYDDNIITIESASSESRRQLAIQGISSKLSELNSLYKDMDGLFMWNAEKKIMLINNTTGNPIEEKSHLREYIKQSILDEETTVYDDWKIYKINNKYYFIRLVRSGITTVGAFVNVDNFTDKFSRLTSEELEYIYFIDDNGRPLTTVLKLQQLTMDTTMTKNNDYLNLDGEEYIVVGHASTKGAFYLRGLTLKKKILSGLKKVQMVNVLFCISILCVIVNLFRVLNHKISKPVDDIIEGMTRLEEGDWDIRLEMEGNFDEFCKIKNQFNRMASQINQLKIDIYEEHISKQNAELKYLQLQINPHFFMNSLNVIYSLVVTRNDEIIKKMLLGLVKHCRYTLKVNENLVYISEELNFIENFVEIQRMRFYYKLDYKVTIDEGILNHKILPLIIHTFIENSIKYAVSDMKTVSINLSITSKQRENQSFILICIEDNGPGFSKEVLKSLSEVETFVDQEGEEHYGITNVLQRFWIRYKISDGIILTNTEQGGAKVEIWLPQE